MNSGENVSFQMKSTGQNGTDRRSFLGLIAGIGVAAASMFDGSNLIQGAAQEVTPQATSSQQGQGPWVLTLGGSDGPHPPFVSNSRRLLAAPELLDAPDEWLDRSLQWIDYIVRNYPPGLVELPQRRPALFRLDEILHIESAPRKTLVQNFYQMRVQHAIEEIENTKVTEGMRIWRTYNQGALVRTPTVSFTFDIVPGTFTPGFSISDEWLKRLVAQSDATFISHRHGDHANKEVARMFLAANKPVIAPEGLWADDADLAKQLTYPERGIDKVHEIRIQGGSKILKVVSYPGHQGPPVTNNVNYVLTPDGFSVLQTGDQSGDEGPETDFDWLAQIGHYHHTDVLLVDGWANDLHRIVRGVNPELVIPGHENEMSHPVPHREEYTQDYERLFGLHYPFIVMSWGESYLYIKPAQMAGYLPDED
jgi:L-ascorbate metabolism protein UlaG (beta-lactamase superfamily)